GALQGILLATQQNAMAARISRASAVASQVRTALQRRGLQALALDARAAPAGLAPSAHGSLWSTSLPAGTTGVAKLFALTASNACWIDLDAPGNAAFASWLVEGYAPSDQALFTRALFVIPLVDADSPGVASGLAFGVGVFAKGSGKAMTKQFTVLYN